ncbi:MAG: isocitrate/isopropylmalate dehydrogenase family protein [Candidatus Puniceispirillaceae bacterium]
MQNTADRKAEMMAQDNPKIAVIKGDGIGVDVTESALSLLEKALAKSSAIPFIADEIKAGAGLYRDTGRDIEEDGEARAGQADAIFLGAIGLPAIRYEDGTEISPHLRLRDKFGLYAGVRPVKAYPNAPQKLADKRAATLDLVILRESTEGLFYSAAVHNRHKIEGDEAVYETLKISRTISEKLHHFGYRLAQRRKERGLMGKLTCVDKANVFASMAFFRKIYFEIGKDYPDVIQDTNYVDAMALDLVRKPWEFDVLVTENIFGDILSDLAGGLVGGMGMAACGEIGDDIGLFQPAHGSAPDIMGQDKANPLAAILSAALMADYIADKNDNQNWAKAGQVMEQAVDTGFAQNRLRPMEFGGDMGTKAITDELSQILDEIS